MTATIIAMSTASVISSRTAATKMMAIDANCATCNHDSVMPLVRSI
jgi:hypothetical protein